MKWSGMTVIPKDGAPSEDIIIRLRARLDDDAHTLMEEGGSRFLAYRVKGETIDLLRSLEHLSESVTKESYRGVEKVVLISDRNVEVLPGSMLEPKLDAKERDDQSLFVELREKLTKHLSPIVFTTENDILELYRTAVRLEGSRERTDVSVGLDLAKTDIPREGAIVYLIFDDGYRKMGLRELDGIIDSALRSLREGPGQPGGRGDHGPEERPATLDRAATTSPIAQNAPPSLDLSSPKLIAKEFSRNMVSLGYRKDAVFSRNDANQFFFIGMNLPAVFFKVLEDREELSAFLRVLSHRKDAIGVLITKEWMPDLEALSLRHGFIYLESSKAHLAHEVVMHSTDGGAGR
jgi:hypothetical protein